MSQINNRWPIIAILMALLITVAGCSSGSSAGSSIDPDTGKHPDNWIEKHQDEFIETFLSNPAKCEECHGSDPVLRGGISDVSCFNSKCHNSPNGAPVRHVLNGIPISNWMNGSVLHPLHGTAAKATPSARERFCSLPGLPWHHERPIFWRRGLWPDLFPWLPWTGALSTS